jgi:multiple sugar transport system permease protein
MRNFFDAVPRELEEAAFIDGASVLQAFRRVVLPVSAPGLAATAVLCFIMSWNEFFFALILTRREAVTAPVGIMSFMRYEATDFGLIATAAIIIALPVVLFSYVVRRYLVAGIMTGAVK